MDNKWQRVFAHMTGYTAIREAAMKSFLLSCLATILTIPHFHYLLSNFSNRYEAGDLHLSGILLGQSALFFLACMLSLLTGYFFMRRYSLPGFGHPGQWFRDFPFLVVTGLLIIFIYCALFGRNLDTGAAAYPDKWLYLILFPLNSMFSDELIFRFGLVTIAVGLCRNKIAGVLLSALFAAILTEKYVDFTGMDVDSQFFGIRFAFSFGVHFLLGYLFVSRGLFHSMTVRMIIEMRYPAIVLLFS